MGDQVCRHEGRSAAFGAGKVAQQLGKVRARLDEEHAANHDHANADGNDKTRENLSALAIPQAPSPTGMQTTSNEQRAEEDHYGADDGCDVLILHARLLLACR